MSTLLVIGGFFLAGLGALAAIGFRSAGPASGGPGGGPGTSGNPVLFLAGSAVSVGGLVALIVGATFITLDSGKERTASARPAPSKRTTPTEEPAPTATPSRSAPPSAPRSASASASAGATAAYTAKVLRVRKVDGCQASHQIPHVDLDSATSYPKLGNGADFSYGAKCFGERGLFVASGVTMGFAGDPAAAAASRAVCDETARSGGADSPVPPEQLVKGKAICVRTGQKNTALMVITAVEGAATTKVLPALTFTVTLWPGG